jgi:hypothetical protein
MIQKTYRFTKKQKDGKTLNTYVHTNRCTIYVPL